MKEVVYFFLAVLTVWYIGIGFPLAVLLGGGFGLLANAPEFGAIVVAGPPTILMVALWYFILRWGRKQDRLRAGRD